MAIISPPLPSLILLFSPTARGYVAYVAISPYLYSLFRFLSSFLYLRFAPFQFFSFLSSLFPFHPSLHISSIFRTDVPRLTSRCNRSNSLIARVDFPPNRKAPYFIRHIRFKLLQIYFFLPGFAVPRGGRLFRERED